jgi:dTDP-4-amino-4,6-dideoxygalactose transaminase
MCNATLALELVARALGMTGEVIVPSFTFVATVHALAWQGAVPVFCDVDPRTHCLDPERVEALITPRTTGIVGVHVWGRACDVDALADIAARHQLPLVFDAAHAFGCSHRAQPIGGFGRAEVFSFHATKFVNAFEGGAVTTNDDELDRKLRLARNFGFTDYDKVDALGLNAKMHEASAAMGITSIESMDDVIAINRRNMARYERGLSGLRGISLYRGDAGDRSNYQYVVVEVDAADASIDRDALVRVLHAENVMARKYFYPGCHQLEPYRSRWPDAGRSLPHTEALTSRVMCLPTGTAVADTDIDAICSVVRAAIARSDEVRAALRA